MAVFIRHESCEKCGSSDAKPFMTTVLQMAFVFLAGQQKHLMNI